MSIYTALEIVGWIVAAAVVGGMMGWLLSLARRDENLARALDAADARARASATTVATREREIIQLTEQAQRVAIEGRETAGALRVQLAAAQDHRDQARASLADARAEIEKLRAEGRASHDQLERVRKQLQDARAAVDHLTGECTNAQRLLAAAEVERDMAISERNEVRLTSATLTTLQGERDRAVGQADALSLRLDDAIERRTAAEDALVAARAEVDRLKAVIATGAGLDGEESTQLAARTAERDVLLDSVARLEDLYRSTADQKADVERVVASLQESLEAERIDHAASRATLTAVLQERNHLRGLLGVAMSAPPADAPVADDPTTDDHWDDLSRLKGVGAKTASRLAGLGIVRFDQLAALDRAGVEALARNLGLSVDRTVDQDWPAQAQALIDEV